jgi:hypothetical protein
MPTPIRRYDGVTAITRNSRNVIARGSGRSSTPRRLGE